MNSNCDSVISLKQYGPTCWFNSILIGLYYIVMKVENYY